MNTYTNFQRTLKQSVSFVGLGLHSGKKARITLKPCDDATGIFFRRADVDLHQAYIAARWHKVTDTRLSTKLTNRYGNSVCTVEHLLAALRLCHIDNLEIEVDGPEVPIMDGSAKPFVDTLLSIGTRVLSEPRQVILIHKAVAVQDDERYALLLPDTEAKITVSINFKEAAIGAQTLSVNMHDSELMQSIAPARTFGFMNQVESLRKTGLVLGGSLNNAVLVDDAHIVNPEGLRFENEFVRHKVLDAIGDLSLIGVTVIGHYHAYKGGYLLNKLLINKLLSDKSAWSLISMQTFHQLHGKETMLSDEMTVQDPAIEAFQARALAK